MTFLRRLYTRYVAWRRHRRDVYITVNRAAHYRYDRGGDTRYV